MGEKRMGSKQVLKASWTTEDDKKKMEAACKDGSAG
jgi:hypothetical protein